MSPTRVATTGRSSHIAFNNPDFVRFAESFGAAGLRMERCEDVTPVLKRVLEMSGPVLVDVPIDYRDNLALCEAVRPSHNI